MRCEDDPAIQYMIPMRTQAAHEEHVPEHDENIFMTDQEITRRNRGRNFNTQRELCPFFESGSGANESFGALEDEELQEWDQLKENQIKFGKPIPVFDAEEYGIAVNQDATKDGENDNEYETWANNTQDMDEETRYSRVLPPPASSFIEEDSLTSELSSEEVVLRESNISGEDYDTVELRGLPAALNYIVNDWQDWLEGDIEEFVPMKKEEFPPELIEWLEENQHHVNPMLRTGLIKEGFIKPLPRPPRPPKVVQEDAQTNLNETSSVDVSMPRPGGIVQCAPSQIKSPPIPLPPFLLEQLAIIRKHGTREEKLAEETTLGGEADEDPRRRQTITQSMAGLDLRMLEDHGGLGGSSEGEELSWADIAKRSAATPLEDITRDFTDKTQDN
ncbi:hypothetical protein GUITHDRAFT_105878 [Guillardia theta CCMP2712]|uniref:Uncharacterized protein n=1 Tax=Guillardia theta (strain CCMP2712) TaxID=905079 RepID=L1JJG7_GUITC|nr:hypothetical protein GUITHDRAFT_105878 [Guillardia theta CCMP2712]EKX48274.1 hypothetical protein GUITHDRAFT_105878 [Guillardia theta CCMP2712]|eukprot:XP_005835254.1 hypothetical protein GUITHDRAFT_105878 [Guillardia theta CCMP2712]